MFSKVLYIVLSARLTLLYAQFKYLSVLVIIDTNILNKEASRESPLPTNIGREPSLHFSPTRWIRRRGAWARRRLARPWAAQGGGPPPAGGRLAEGKRKGRERYWREEQIGENKIYRGVFVIFCQPDITWHATSALEAGVARLGHRMEYLTKFRDLGGRFESLGT